MSTTGSADGGAASGSVVDLSGASTVGLLRLYAAILDELVHRRVVRSRNAPVEDLAELLVARALGGELAPSSKKSWDVALPDGRRLQVKSRVLADGDCRSHNFSPFRSYDFDACVFVVLDALTYDVRSAVEVPCAAVESLARETTWVRGTRVGTRAPLLDAPGAVDRTAQVAAALAGLDADPQDATWARSTRPRRSRPGRRPAAGVTGCR